MSLDIRTRATALLAFTMGLFCVCATPATAHAQEVEAKEGVGFEARAFTPTAGPYGIFTTERSDILEHLELAVRAIADYANEPLLTENADGQSVPVIDGMATLNLAAALGLWHYVEVGAVIPFVLLNEGRVGGRELGDSAVGDLALRVKVRALDNDDVSGFGLAFGVDLGVPVGDETEFSGAGGVTFRAFAAPDMTVGPVVIAANLGAVAREKASARNIERSHAFDYRLGVDVEAVENLLHVASELYGSVPFTDQAGDSAHMPLEWLLGMRVLTPSDLHFTVAGGSGLTNGVGTPRFRVLAGAEYAPLDPDRDDDGLENQVDGCPDRPEDSDGHLDDDGCPDEDNDDDGIADVDDNCPNEPEDEDGVDDDDGCPDPDTDGDGVDDDVDICPEEAEDIDTFEDEDGCPDPDNDGDGFADLQDECPLEAEDDDGFQDDDGCPDEDNDDDGVPDSSDRCPDEPEDDDDHRDDDGCPDPDNDGDGVYDADDLCPEELEVVNGVDDHDGCPDTGGQTLVSVEGDQIALLDDVSFEPGKAFLKPDAYNVLNQSALVLRANPQIEKLRVEAHTHPSDDPEADLQLTQQQAEAVVGYLLGQGVEESRLEAVGYGGTRPVSEGSGRRARRENTRVELVIVE